MLYFDESANGSEVELSSGQRFEICLRENPTTGFRWQLGSNGAPACVLVSDHFEPAGGPPGQGGDHRWHFEAGQDGVGTIVLLYRRPWKQQEAPAHTFTLQVRVRP